MFRGDKGITMNSEVVLCLYRLENKIKKRKEKKKERKKRKE